MTRFHGLEFNYKELKKTVISSGEDIESFQDFCKSGKRLNLFNMFNGYGYPSYNTDAKENIINFSRKNIGEKEEVKIVQEKL